MTLGLAGLVDLFDHVDVDADALVAEDNPFARGRAVLAALRELAGQGRRCSRSTTCSGSTCRRRARCGSRCAGSTREPVGLLATVRRAPRPLAAAATLPPRPLRDGRPRPARARRAAPRPGRGRRVDLAPGAAADPAGLGRQPAVRDRARARARRRRRPPRSPGLRLPDSLQAAIARAPGVGHRRALPAARDGVRARPHHGRRAARRDPGARRRRAARRAPSARACSWSRRTCACASRTR